MGTAGLQEAPRAQTGRRPEETHHQRLLTPAPAKQKNHFQLQAEVCQAFELIFSLTAENLLVLMANIYPLQVIDHIFFLKSQMFFFFLKS